MVRETNWSETILFLTHKKKKVKKKKRASIVFTDDVPFRLPALLYYLTPYSVSINDFPEVRMSFESFNKKRKKEGTREREQVDLLKETTRFGFTPHHLIAIMIVKTDKSKTLYIPSRQRVLGHLASVAK